MTDIEKRMMKPPEQTAECLFNSCYDRQLYNEDKKSYYALFAKVYSDVEWYDAQVMECMARLEAGE